MIMDTSISEAHENVQKMAWDYFQLLAQQRVTHFNLFIVFIGAISAAFATQINESVRGNIIACVLSVIEVFLCFIFYKIDQRNKFLIKHTEKVIIQTESYFEEGIPKLFAGEVESTASVRKGDMKKLYFFRQLSTSQLYNLFYGFFFIIGVLALVLSVVMIIIN